MKLKDILLEKPSTNLVVIKSAGEYRVDPNPDHSEEDYKSAWTKDLSKATVFKEKAARRFVSQRAQHARDSKFSHPDMKIVQVDVDEKGRPLMPGTKQKSGLFGKLKAA